MFLLYHLRVAQSFESVALCIALYEDNFKILTKSESVTVQILNESYQAVLSRGIVYYLVQGGFKVWMES